MCCFCTGTCTANYSEDDNAPAPVLPFGENIQNHQVIIPEEGELTGESVLVGLESHKDLEKLYEKLSTPASPQGRRHTYAELHSLGPSYQSVDSYADEYLGEKQSCGLSINQGDPAQARSAEKLAGFIGSENSQEPKDSMRRWEAKQVNSKWSILVRFPINLTQRLFQFHAISASEYSFGQKF